MKFARALGWAGCGAFVLGAGLIWAGFLIPNQPPRSRYPLRGVDVSHHNGFIDWAAVAAGGYDFAFLKATEGASFRDPNFAANWSAACASGIVCGAYHFFSTLSTGEKQADNFIQTVPRVSSMLPPVIDLEFDGERSQMNDKQFVHNLQDLSGRLERHYGVAPILYTTREFHRDQLGDKSIARLWVRAVIAWPHDAAGNWLFWQYSSRGRVNGIAGSVDLNVFRGERQELQALLTTSDKNGGQTSH